MTISVIKVLLEAARWPDASVNWVIRLMASDADTSSKLPGIRNSQPRPLEYHVMISHSSRKTTNSFPPRKWRSVIANILVNAEALYCRFDQRTRCWRPPKADIAEPPALRHSALNAQKDRHLGVRGGGLVPMSDTTLHKRPSTESRQQFSRQPRAPWRKDWIHTAGPSIVIEFLFVLCTIQDVSASCNYTEVDAPEQAYHGSDQDSIVDRHDCKVQNRDEGPELPAIDHKRKRLPSNLTLYRFTLEGSEGS